MEGSQSGSEEQDSDKVSTKQVSAASTPAHQIRSQKNVFRPRSCQASPCSKRPLHKECPDCQKLKSSLQTALEHIENLKYKLRIQEEMYERTIGRLEREQADSMVLAQDLSESETGEEVAALNRMVVELQIYSTDLRNENQALHLQVQVFRERKTYTVVEGKIESEAVFRSLFAEDMLKLEEGYKADIDTLQLEYDRCNQLSKERIQQLQNVVFLSETTVTKWVAAGKMDDQEADILAAKFDALSKSQNNRIPTSISAAGSRKFYAEKTGV